MIRTHDSATVDTPLHYQSRMRVVDTACEIQLALSVGGVWESIPSSVQIGLEVVTYCSH